MEREVEGRTLKAVVGREKAVVDAAPLRRAVIFSTVVEEIIFVGGFL